jgi:hypothetical protein
MTVPALIVVIPVYTPYIRRPRFQNSGHRGNLACALPFAFVRLASLWWLAV